MHKAIVKQKEMSDENLNVVISVTEDAENKNLDEKEIASTVKKALEANLGGAWQVVVGRTFGSSFHHEDNFFAYVFVGNNITDATTVCYLIGHMMDNFERLVTRLEHVTSKLERILCNNSTDIKSSGDGVAETGSTVGEIPSIVKLFDDAIKSTLDELVDAGQKIGGDVYEITCMAKEALEALRMFLWNASGTKKPDDSAIGALLKPISEKIEVIQKFTGSRRASPYFNHLSTISEGIPALGWVTISPTPAPYIKEMVDAAQFYVNRVLKDYKEKDRVHVDWARLWPKLLIELQMYVKQHHTTGLVWNSSPGSKAPVIDAVAPKKPAAGPPGPPPPPPLSFMQELKHDAGGKSEADSRAALFADINKGLDITKNLKKVTDDMKTHKNPALKQSAPAPETAGAKGSQPMATKSLPVQQHTPKLTLEGGKKWVIEYLKDDKNAVVRVDDMKQVAYIFKCTNSVIQFKGKINSITMDGCTNTSIVFDDVVACVEIINCQRTQIQSMGKLPTLAIQKTDGCQIYLSKESLNAEIVSSKSSEMNLLIPNANGEYDEFALPEQYKTVWNGKKLVTTVVDIA